MRAVGFNPEAARYGGVSVARNYFLAMAISGAFAGLAGALDITGWEYRIGENDIQASSIGFIGLAAALLGRNTALGVGVASLLFGALINGTSGRQLDPSIFRPDLAGNLTTIIQGLVILFVGLNLGGIGVWLEEAEEARHDRDRAHVSAGSAGPTRRRSGSAASRSARSRSGSRCRRSRRGRQLLPILLGILAIAAGIWTWSREQRRVGGGAVAAGVLGIALGVLATRSSTAHLDTVVVWSALLAATLRYATPLTFAAIGGLFCERSGVINVALEGMLLTGAFFGIWGAIWAHGWAPGWEWVIGLITAALAGMAMAAIHAFWAIHLKVDQIISGTAINFLALGITGYIFIDKYGDTRHAGQRRRLRHPRRAPPLLENWYFIGPIIGQLNLMIWLSFVLLIGTYIFVFRTPYGLRLRSVGEHPRAADTVGISVYKIRYIAVIASGAIAAMGGAYLSLGFVHSFNESMTSGTGFIGLAALVFGEVAAVPDLVRDAALRLLERARRPAAERLRQPVGHALQTLAVRADARSRWPA